MKSLPLRVVSAVVAILVFTLAYYFFSAFGVFTFAFLACFVGCFEFSKMALTPLAPPTTLKYLFLIICFVLFGILFSLDRGALPTAIVVIIYYVFCSLWLMAKKYENEKILSYVALSILGFFYSVFLPAFALKLLLLKDGLVWFIFLLGIVFAGDTMAYFGGILFGKTKIMPQVSPNKTLAGAITGLMGSILFAFVFCHFVSMPMTTIQLFSLSLIAGALAQTGDLFESLVKRVAHVKDSGQLMPGHGGSLDRFDGVYFAAPLIFAVAWAMQI